ncbi:hypothetical protein L195_g029729, partial [Trifolium pratense]
EENVDQSSCTLSSSSTLTQRTSLGTATVQHKKRTRDSDCDSRFYSPTNMNEEELFNQLFKARLGHSPYDKYDGWPENSLSDEIIGYKNDVLEELIKVCEEKAGRIPILPSTSDRRGIREYRKEEEFYHGHKHK